MLRKLTIFKWGVGVCITFSTHQESNRGLSHAVVLDGGDVKEIDDFHKLCKRLIYFFKISTIETSTFICGRF